MANNSMQRTALRAAADAERWAGEEVERNVEIELGQSEALVLFEFLARFEESDQLPVPDPAEELALWRLAAALERVLVEPLQPEHERHLEAARTRLLKENGAA